MNANSYSAVGWRWGGACERHSLHSIPILPTPKDTVNCDKLYSLEGCTAWKFEKVTKLSDSSRRSSSIRNSDSFVRVEHKIKQPNDKCLSHRWNYTWKSSEKYQVEKVWLRDTHQHAHKHDNQIACNYITIQRHKSISNSMISVLDNFRSFHFICEKRGLFDVKINRKWNSFRLSTLSLTMWTMWLGGSVRSLRPHEIWWKSAVVNMTGWNAHPLYQFSHYWWDTGW